MDLRCEKLAVVYSVIRWLRMGSEKGCSPRSTREAMLAIPLVDKLKAVHNQDDALHNPLNS